MRHFPSSKPSTIRSLFSTPAASRWTVITLITTGAAGFSIAVSPTLTGLLGACLALIAVIIAASDARYFIIPDEAIGAALALAAVNAAVTEPQAIAVSIGSAGLRGALLALGFWLLRFIYARLRGCHGIGLGDVKLASVAGAWLDWPMIALVVEMAALASLAFYSLRQLINGHEIRAMSRIPFGLFFAPALWVAWLCQAIVSVLP
jgi:leader peptidase (prepilin peptidase) / N-methyltransferase